MTISKAPGKVFIGTSGYNYKHWADGIFYPDGLPEREWLEHYAKFFKTVELNVTFYRLPQEKAFQGWKQRTPPDFSFAIKGSRFITHVKRLKEVQEPLENFFARALILKKKLSVVLWQLSPGFKKSSARLESFLKNLKKYEGSRGKEIRNAFEFRHETWLCDDIFKMLDTYGCSLCHADWPEFNVEIPTSGNFVYMRRHGTGGTLYGGCYSDVQLKRDAFMIEEWVKQRKDVYIFFNNDAHGWAIQNALSLQKMLTTR